MTLQAVLENLDGLDQSISSHYIEKDGKFHLDIEGIETDKKDRAAHDKSDWIPRSRFNEVNEKRKSIEKELSEIAEDLKSSVPEDFQDLIPDLPPGKLISWLRNTSEKGLFDSKSKESIDSKRPSDQKPKDFEGMSPQAIMATGYNK